ncbi:MAG: 6-bladed beta-propeller, partial [Bacteroidales bacterium]|nr:6-bladed beta-propeller [Bacteroidales bacterium]
MKKVLPVILPACFMLAGCRMSSDNSNRQDLNECPQVAELRQVNTHKVVVCDPHLFKDTVILPLSHFTEELQIVKLENTAEALVSESPVIIGNHHILVNMRWSDKTPYRLFDKSGRFITNIGTFGKGPNEYMYISDQQLDEKNGRIFLLPVNSKKILVYDLNGNSYDPIPLPYQSSRSRIYVDQADSTLSVITLPLRDSRFAAPYFAWMQKLSGKIINGISSKGFELEGKHVLGGFFQIFSGNNTPEKDFLIFSFIPRKDTLYHYDMEGNRLIPQFTVDFKDNQIPIHVYWELPHHYMGDLSESEEVQPRQWTTKNHKYYVLEKA